MRINILFELTMVVNSEKFYKILPRDSGRDHCLIENEDEYIDQFLTQKGITVIYRDSQYKKKIRLIINPELIVKSNVDDPERLVRKLEKLIIDYFRCLYKIDDFTLSGMILSTDINVGSHENVSAYLKVLQRIGKVKGFSPVIYDCFEDGASFCLNGNSNGIGFMIYDLQNTIIGQMEKTNVDRRKIKTAKADTEGILRAEVRLTKPKAIRMYASEPDTPGQIADLSEKCKDVFYDIFTRIVPFGDYYKKDRAEEIVRAQVTDRVMRRKMIRLLALIPEKKSLYLAQKAMNCRDIGKVMDAFAKINVSPVSVSKRHDVKCLKNLYSYIV